MAEISNIIGHSFVQNPVQHVVSVGTMSAGAAGKILIDEPASIWELIVSLSSDMAIIAGLFLTCFLIYRAFRADRIDQLTILKLKLEIAEKDRRSHSDN